MDTGRGWIWILDGPLAEEEDGVGVPGATGVVSQFAVVLQLDPTLHDQNLILRLNAQLFVDAILQSLYSEIKNML